MMLCIEFSGLECCVNTSTASDCFQCCLFSVISVFNLHVLFII
jgi:hypothetical protein